MKFICVQPYNNYFIWQVQVMLHNFRKWGIEGDAIILFAGGEQRQGVVEFRDDCKVFHYPDKRTDKSYISSIRPHILKQFFDQHDIDDNIFYHDCDILFSRHPTFEFDGSKILASDCVSYIGGRYIRSKSEELFTAMCNIVGIDHRVVIGNETCSGGAQYLIPKKFKTNFGFWEKVERNSTELYSFMSNTADKYNPEHPIQAWTADMWAVLWNFWMMGWITETPKQMDFSWATMPIEEYNKNIIFHNAGVTAETKELFFKGQYIDKHPSLGDHSNVSDKFCSYKYLQEVKETFGFI